jgi:hypothetical protein
VDEQISHYEDIAHIDPECMMNFNESYHGKGKWKQMYGKGRFRAIKKEWVIGGKRFSIWAIYTQNGFLAWEIFERPITQHDICRLVKEYLRTFIQRGRSLPLFDNASIHTSQLVLRTIDRVINNLGLLVFTKHVYQSVIDARFNFSKKIVLS